MTDDGYPTAKCRGTLVVSVNAAWNLANFRSGLIVALRRAGYRVVAVAPSDRHVDRVRATGCEFIDFPFAARGMNPAKDAALCLRYAVLLRRLRPSAFLGFTIKPNIYGSLAAHALGIPVVNNVAGLGTTFSKRGWVNRLVGFLYRLALRRSRKIFFQNDDDRALFVSRGLVQIERTGLLPGSGVDLDRFSPRTPVAANGGQLKVLMVARLLWEKGVAELVEAVRLIRANGIDAKAYLLGFVDGKNAAFVPLEQILQWQEVGLVAYLGEVEDVRDAIAGADVVALPSFYPEGTPRSLLESAAMAKPLIVTDAPGCRDVVSDGVNGYVVPPRDAHALADALARFMGLTADERVRMGDASRSMVEARYGEGVVVDAYLRALDTLVG